MSDDLTARDLKAIAQLLHARRGGPGGLAISQQRIGQLSARFAVLAGDAEDNGWTMTLTKRPSPARLP